MPSGRMTAIMLAVDWQVPRTVACIQGELKFEEVQGSLPLWFRRAFFMVFTSTVPSSLRMVRLVQAGAQRAAHGGCR